MSRHDRYPSVWTRAETNGSNCRRRIDVHSRNSKARAEWKLGDGLYHLDQVTNDPTQYLHYSHICQWPVEESYSDPCTSFSTRRGAIRLRLKSPQLPPSHLLPIPSPPRSLEQLQPPDSQKPLLPISISISFPPSFSDFSRRPRVPHCSSYERHHPLYRKDIYPYVSGTTPERRSRARIAAPWSTSSILRELSPPLSNTKGRATLEWSASVGRSLFDRGDQHRQRGGGSSGRTARPILLNNSSTSPSLNDVLGLSRNTPARQP